MSDDNTISVSQVGFPNPVGAKEVLSDEEAGDLSVQIAQDFIRANSPGMRTDFPDPDADWPEGIEVGIEPTEVGPGGRTVADPLEGMFVAEEAHLNGADVLLDDYEHRKAFEDLQHFVLRHPVLSWLVPVALVIHRMIAMREAGNPYPQVLPKEPKEPRHILWMFHRWSKWGSPVETTATNLFRQDPYAVIAQIRTCVVCDRVETRTL